MESSPQAASQASELPMVWLDRESIMPDVCSTCGMFTDRRARVSLVHWVAEKERLGGLSVSVLLFVVDLLIGPLSWLVQSSSTDPAGATQVKQKVRLKISRCQLCEAMGPLVSAASRGSRFGFHVHPRFAREFTALNRPGG